MKPTDSLWLLTLKDFCYHQMWHCIVAFIPFLRCFLPALGPVLQDPQGIWFGVSDADQ